MLVLRGKKDWVFHNFDTHLNRMIENQQNNSFELIFDSGSHQCCDSLNILYHSKKVRIVLLIFYYILI